VDLPVVLRHLLLPLIMPVLPLVFVPLVLVMVMVLVLVMVMVPMLVLFLKLPLCHYCWLKGEERGCCYR
jgi:hypothetical protein